MRVKVWFVEVASLAECLGRIVRGERAYDQSESSFAVSVVDPTVGLRSLKCA
jgi:hypothetical protein